MTTMTRRELLKASGTAGLVLGAPAILSAQSKEPIPIGTLCPLTGAGGSYGPDMQRSVVAVVERINKAGGIHGRPIQLFHEDDQTNAEAGVRAARKLIDVNKVVAIVSTWASAVTLAVKPLCVEARVFVIGVSGADSVTQGDHKGYIARTQPNTQLQGRMYAKFVATKKEWKRVAYMALQTPYAQSFGDAFAGVLKAAGVTITDSLVYEDKKPSYRSEVTRVLATNPDLIMLEGYTPDSIVMAKDIYKAAYKGAILGPSFAINAKFIEGVGAEVAEGNWNMDRAPLFDSRQQVRHRSRRQAQFHAAGPLARDAMAVAGVQVIDFTGRNARGGRRSRVVLAPRPWRLSFPACAGEATVTKNAAHRGELEVSRKAIAWGKPGCLGCTCSPCPCASVHGMPVCSRARDLRAQSAPGFPCALCGSEG